MSNKPVDGLSNLNLALSRVGPLLQTEEASSSDASIEYQAPEEVDSTLGLSVGEEIRILGAGSAPRQLKIQRRRGAKARKSSDPVPPLAKAQLESIAAGIDRNIINPMLATERSAVVAGSLFYLFLAVAAVLTGLITRAAYSSIVSLAVGTGGAVVALQPFQASITSYLRTKQTLNSIKSAWTFEGQTNIAQAQHIEQQMQDFLDQATKMPSAYASASGSATK